jgi:hypothetical protein
MNEMHCVYTWPQSIKKEYLTWEQRGLGGEGGGGDQRGEMAQCMHTNKWINKPKQKKNPLNQNAL